MIQLLASSIWRLLKLACTACLIYSFTFIWHFKYVCIYIQKRNAPSIHIKIEAAARRKCEKLNAETMKYKTDHLTQNEATPRRGQTIQHRTQTQGQSAAMKAKPKDFSVFLRVFTQKRQHDHGRFSVVRSALKHEMLEGKFVAIMYESLRAYFQEYNVFSHRRLGARFSKDARKVAVLLHHMTLPYSRKR